MNIERNKKYYVVGRMVQYLQPSRDGAIGYLEVYQTKKEAKKSAGKTYQIWIIAIKS